MFIKDGIVYAGEPAAPIKVLGVRALPDYKLWLRFSTGEAGVFDLSDQLIYPAFAPLRDPEVFRSVYIDFGTVTWLDGKIDIASEYLHQNSVKEGGIAGA